MIPPNSSFYVAGHKGLIGSAFLRRLQSEGHSNIVVRTREELDLRDGHRVHNFFREARPDVVINCAARVGGIIANRDYPAEFITENLEIQLNLIRESHGAGVKQFLFFGSSCMYPRGAEQPMREDVLWSGELESTNFPYAVAKLAGLAMCEAYNQQFGSTRFLTVIPNNTYGPYDNLDPETSHVLSAIMGKIHRAHVTGSPSVTLWGTGRPRREFVYVDDIVDAGLFLLNSTAEDLTSPVNIGSGEDHSIRELAEVISSVIGFTGQLEFDSQKPDGTPRKLLEGGKLRKLGWHPRVSLREGVERTYEWYLTQV